VWGGIWTSIIFVKILQQVKPPKKFWHFGYSELFVLRVVGMRIGESFETWCLFKFVVCIEIE
jgi:hypothetical protein